MGKEREPPLSFWCCVIVQEEIPDLGDEEEREQKRKLGCIREVRKLISEEGVWALFSHPHLSCIEGSQ